MNEKNHENIRDIIKSCLENVGIDSNLLDSLNSDNNILKLMDSFQYISFIAEIENHLSLVLLDEFLLIENFSSFDDFMIKLEYYDKGWKESYNHNKQMKGDDINEITEAEKNGT